MNEPATPAPVVLVVEDEALVRMLAVDVLEEAGFEVIPVMAEDQEPGLRAAHVRESPALGQALRPGSLGSSHQNASDRATPHAPIAKVVIQNTRSRVRLSIQARCRRVR